MAHIQNLSKDHGSDWYQLLKSNCQSSLIAAAVFSGVANLLMLVPAFFMLNVYDKALGSNSVSTLVVLSVITIVMFCGLAAMDVLRSRMLIGISKKIDTLIAPLVYEATFQYAFAMGPEKSTIQPLVDFNKLKQFVSGNGAITVFDTPWMPIYIGVMFLFHPVLGWLGVVSGILMLILAISNRHATAARLQAANSLSQQSHDITRRNIANVEVAAAMGMLEVLQQKWAVRQKAAVEMQVAASSKGGLFTSLTKTLRLAIQSLAIGVGALLVLQQEISPGMLIAGSILVSRALQPIELAVASWDGFVEARGQYDRLKQLLDESDWEQDRMALPALLGGVSANSAEITPPASKFPALRNSSFNISPGSVCMIMGPSGAGKSTLVRGILGLWPTSSGDIRIDGVEASKYNRQEIGPQVGYLPQDIELFDGTVSSNIARQGEVSPEDIILAARDAGLHDFILSLPDGYDTELGEEKGVVLSPGQRQRIALARALYRRPALVVLDEPNSNLDSDGEAALNNAIQTLKTAGSTVIIVSHREGAKNLADQLLLVISGEVVDSGAPVDVMTRRSRPQTRPQIADERPKPAIKTIPVGF